VAVDDERIQRPAPDDRSWSKRWFVVQEGDYDEHYGDRGPAVLSWYKRPSDVEDDSLRYPSPQQVYSLEHAVLWMTSSEFALALPPPPTQEPGQGRAEAAATDRQVIVYFASNARGGHLAVLAKFVEVLTCECSVVCGRARSMHACERETYWDYAPTHDRPDIDDVMQLVGDGCGVYVSRVSRPHFSAGYSYNQEGGLEGQEEDMMLRQIHSGMRVEAVEGHDVVGLPLPLLKLRIKSAAAAASPYAVSIIFGVVHAAEAPQAAARADKGEDLCAVLEANAGQLTNIMEHDLLLC